MARFIVASGVSDLEIHHEAVRLASQGGPVAKALQRALDGRHEREIQRFASARDLRALESLWEEACRQGEIPGAYWAILSHRNCTPELRQRVFGEVHMLSHLVGAANRADLRQLVALQRENEEMRERLDSQLLRWQDRVSERDRTIVSLQQELFGTRQRLADALASHPVADRNNNRQADPRALAADIAIHTERRDRAEEEAAVASAEAARLKTSLEQLQHHSNLLHRELVAAERQLLEMSDHPATPLRLLEKELRGHRILYVGGRPSSTPAIRDLVQRHGGEFRHHDGGLEDRKGLLASAVAWADLVVFPLDCIDHDSAGNLKRLCARQLVTLLALRSASIASFAAGLSNRYGEGPDGNWPKQPVCLKHG